MMSDQTKAKPTQAIPVAEISVDCRQPIDAQVLAKIEAFLERHGETATGLGIKAVGDGAWVSRFRSRRNAEVQTLQRVIDYMDARDGELQDVDAAE